MRKAPPDFSGRACFAADELHPKAEGQLPKPRAGTKPIWGPTRLDAITKRTEEALRGMLLGCQKGIG